MSKSKVASFLTGGRKGDRDFTQLSLTDDGRVVVEINIWDDTQKNHVGSTLWLAPEEAHLLSKMLANHAKEANLITAKSTALAVSG